MGIKKAITQNINVSKDELVILEKLFTLVDVFHIEKKKKHIICEFSGRVASVEMILFNILSLMIFSNIQRYDKDDIMIMSGITKDLQDAFSVANVTAKDKKETKKKGE